MIDGKRLRDTITNQMRNNSECHNTFTMFENIGLHKALEFLDGMLEADGWVYATERLPEDGRDVLVARRSKGGNLSCDVGRHTPYGWSTHGSVDVFAWRELPELPQMRFEDMLSPVGEEGAR